jgi:Arm DNA-binding domain/Phage integrase central domain
MNTTDTTTVPTTDAEIRDLPTQVKPYKVFLGRGLYVFVAPSGTKSFRFNYKSASGARTHTLGKFGKLTLQQASGMFEQAREKLAAGDCIRSAQLATRKRNRATIAEVFAAWFPVFAATVGPDYAARTRTLLESDDLRALVSRPIGAVTFKQVRDFCRALEVTRSGSFARDTAHALQKVYEYAIQEEIHTGANPAHKVIEKLTPRDSQPWEALQLEQLPQFYADVAGLTTRNAAKRQTVLALQLLPYLTVRPSVLRGAEWTWVKWDTAQLVVPAFAEGTKQRVTTQRADKRGKHYADYIVPLSRQALAILRELHTLTGTGRFVFPGYKGRGKTVEAPISEGRWLSRIRAMGWDGSTDERPAITVHGFRALFATSAYTRYVITRRDEHALEFQQDHKLTEGVRANYTRDKRGSHRGLLIRERADLMQWWADEVDTVRGLRMGQQLPQSRVDMASAFLSSNRGASSFELRS